MRQSGLICCFVVSGKQISALMVPAFEGEQGRSIIYWRLSHADHCPWPVHPLRIVVLALGQEVDVAGWTLFAERSEEHTALEDEALCILTGCESGEKAFEDVQLEVFVSGTASGAGSLLTVLERAAGTEQLPDRAAMRDTYKRLRGLDDGLPPIEKTSLLSHAFRIRNYDDRGSVYGI